MRIVGVDKKIIEKFFSLFNNLAATIFLSQKLKTPRTIKQYNKLFTIAVFCM